MVRRLVEQQDVRVLHGKNGEHNSVYQLSVHKANGCDSPVTQTIGQLADRVGLVGTSDTESADLLSPVLDVLLRELVMVERLQVVHWRFVERQLVGRVLRVLGELELGVSRDGTLDRLQRAGDEVEQGGLSSTVVSDNGDTARQL